MANPSKMVPVNVNGKTVMISQGDLAYIQSWKDLRFAPQSVINLARSYGLPVATSYVRPETSRGGQPIPDNRPPIVYSGSAPTNAQIERVSGLTTQLTERVESYNKSQGTSFDSRSGFSDKSGYSYADASGNTLLLAREDSLPQERYTPAPDTGNIVGGPVYSRSPQKEIYKPELTIFDREAEFYTGTQPTIDSSVVSNTPQLIPEMSPAIGTVTKNPKLFLGGFQPYKIIEKTRPSQTLKVPEGLTVSENPTVLKYVPIESRVKRSAAAELQPEGHFTEEVKRYKEAEALYEKAPDDIKAYTGASVVYSSLLTPQTLEGLTSYARGYNSKMEELSILKIAEGKESIKTDMEIYEKTGKRAGIDMPSTFDNANLARSFTEGVGVGATALAGGVAVGGIGSAATYIPRVASVSLSPTTVGYVSAIGKGIQYGFYGYEAYSGASLVVAGRPYEAAAQVGRDVTFMVGFDKGLSAGLKFFKKAPKPKLIPSKNKAVSKVKATPLPEETVTPEGIITGTEDDVTLRIFKQQESGKVEVVSYTLSETRTPTGMKVGDNFVSSRVIVEQGDDVIKVSGLGTREDVTKFIDPNTGYSTTKFVPKKDLNIEGIITQSDDVAKGTYRTIESPRSNPQMTLNKERVIDITGMDTQALSKKSTFVKQQQPQTTLDVIGSDTVSKNLDDISDYALRSEVTTSIGVQSIDKKTAFFGEDYTLSSKQFTVNNKPVIVEVSSGRKTSLDAEKFMNALDDFQKKNQVVDITQLKERLVIPTKTEGVQQSIIPNIKEASLSDDIANAVKKNLIETANIKELQELNDLAVQAGKEATQAQISKNQAELFQIARDAARQHRLATTSAIKFPSQIPTPIELPLPSPPTPSPKVNIKPTFTGNIIAPPVSPLLTKSTISTSKVSVQKMTTSADALNPRNFHGKYMGFPDSNKKVDIPDNFKISTSPRKIDFPKTSPQFPSNKPISINREKTRLSVGRLSDSMAEQKANLKNAMSNSFVNKKTFDNYTDLSTKSSTDQINISSTASLQLQGLMRIQTQMTTQDTFLDKDPFPKEIKIPRPPVGSFKYTRGTYERGARRKRSRKVRPTMIDKRETFLPKISGKSFSIGLPDVVSTVLMQPKSKRVVPLGRKIFTGFEDRMKKIGRKYGI